MLIKEISGISTGNHLGSDPKSLKNLQRITVMMGKNGSGKSTLLDTLAIAYNDSHTDDARYTVRDFSERKPVRFEKIVPERGGFYELDGGFVTSSNNDQTFYRQQSRGNSQINYRKLVASKLQSYLTQFGFNENLATAMPYQSVGEIITYLNKLLPPKYEVKRKNPGGTLAVYDRIGGDEVSQAALSSGEREVFSLGIDILVTIFQAAADGVYLVLLLDEPDVHLHPDLQSSLLDMITELVNKHNAMQIILGTHSTVFLANNSVTGIIWVQEGISEMKAERIPTWANPLLFTVGKGLLSPLIGGVKTLLVEGADDYVIWQQAIKSSNGRLKIVPFDCGGKGEMPKYIRLINKLLNSLTDATRFRGQIIALKDSDGVVIRSAQVTGHVTKYSTSCHEMENCILSNEIASDEQRIQSGVTDFKMDDIKLQIDSLSSDICGREGEWRRKVGSEIGQLFHADEIESKVTDENSIVNYLGKDFLLALK